MSGCVCNGCARRLPRNVGTSDRFGHRPLAVAVTADGRRVHVPVETPEATPLSLIRSILGVVESLIGLIIGGDRRDGGTRRGER
jgi:hypothetical protein